MGILRQMADADKHREGIDAHIRKKRRIEDVPGQREIVRLPDKMAESHCIPGGGSHRGHADHQPSTITSNVMNAAVPIDQDACLPSVEAAPERNRDEQAQKKGHRDSAEVSLHGTCPSSKYDLSESPERRVASQLRNRASLTWP